jgi:hypothetical protein
MSADGTRLPTLALQQVGSYLGHTGHQINVVITAAWPHAVRPKQAHSHPAQTLGPAMLLRRPVKTSVQRY